MAKILYAIFVLACLYGTSVESALQTVNGTIHMRVGVTSACSDAAAFVVNQVRQTYDLYKEFLDIEFVPWGRSTRNAEGGIVCQFGINDCWANRAQRCVLSLLTNADDRMNYMECEFSPPIPAFNLRSLQCAQAVGLNLIDVDYCISSTQGDALEVPAEQVSVGAVASINFIPFIVFHNNIDVSLNAQAYMRLESTICFALADDPSTGVTHCKI